MQHFVYVATTTDFKNCYVLTHTTDNPFYIDPNVYEIRFISHG
jgi:hypothetical protein